MFELVLARLVDFHLGADNAYLALPIAFLGLALGSLHVHLLPGSIERFSLRRALAVLVGLCVGGLLFAFLFFSWVMPVTATNATVGALGYLAKEDRDLRGCHAAALSQLWAHPHLDLSAAARRHRLDLRG